MTVLYLALATLLTIFVPVLVAASGFFVVLPWWIDRILRSDAGVHERLHLEVSEERIAWAIASDQSTPRLPYPPVAYALIVALSVSAAETAAFASASRVPFLWYASGAIGAVIVLVAPLVTIWLLKNPLRELTDRTLKHTANDRFSFAANAIRQVCETARQIDASYALIGLRPRRNYLERCQRTLLECTRLGRGFAFAEVIGIKTSAEHDLRNLQYLGHLLTNARIALDQAKLGLQGREVLQNAFNSIESRVHSQQLADALEDARWVEAHELLEKIGSDLGRVLDVVLRVSAVPETLDDAHRILNVNDETPLENVKAVVNVYRRVWHPDLTRDEVARQQCTLRIQQINVAWEIVQKARAQRPTPDG